METSGLIERNHADILQNWAREAGRLAPARGLSQPELMNLMPKYLSALALLDGSRDERRRRIEAHLSSRIRAGYRLDEVLEELSILSRCLVTGRGAAGADGGVSTGDLARLYDAIVQDAAVVNDSFAEYVREDERAERLYLRRLQELGDALEVVTAADVREGHWKEVLAMTMEAVGAQCAAIVLYDPGSRSLRVAASLGVVEPPMRYASDGAPRSFVAAVAACDEGTSSLDAATTDLEVSAALRSSDIRALLGVRLPMQRELRGVMYVGAREGAAFTTRQVRRLEALGEALSLHLERAWRADTLRAILRDTQAERERLERFISMLAHDLRGPLSIVRLGAHILQGDSERLGAHREVPERMLRSVVRADRMVHDLLDVLRVRAGHGLPLLLAKCDLAEVARATVDELTVLYGDRFVLHVAPRAEGVWSADSLQRALWNLIVNAVKYGTAEGPIVVSLRRLDAGVALSVHNRGLVIPEADREGLFKPFTQLAVRADGASLGWGLGLTMVKGCAEAHGGDVDVESSADAGTTFTITLPFDSRPYQPAAPTGRESLPIAV